MRINLLKALGLSIASLAFASSAFAQEHVADHGKWAVFTLNQGGNKTCYIASAPIQKEGNYNKRGDAYVLVTHRSATTDEVSISAGYPFKEGSKAKVTVDGKNFEFFTKDELAWAYDEAQDADTVKAMKKGNKLSVRASSKKDSYSVDTYSLSGISAAYNQMKSLCQ